MRSVVFLLAPGLLVAAMVAAEDVDLAGPWRFHDGDDAAWAEPGLDDSAWTTVRIPTGWGRTSPVASLAWYRRRVQVDPAAARVPPGLAVLVGKVDSAYEIYAGGQRLGGVGSLPPQPRMDYDRDRIYVLPPSAVPADGSLVLALRVWKSPDTESSVGGPVEGTFLLGPSLDLQRRFLLTELVQLFLGGLFVLVGLYHLQLFYRRPNLREYLWYALAAIDAGVYCLLRTQWKYTLIDRFVLLKEIEYVALLLMAPLFVQFVWTLVGAPISRRLRLHQAWSVGLAAVMAATPGLWLNTHALPFWELSLLPLVAATVLLLIREVRRAHPEARPIALGLSIFMLVALHDMAVDRGLLSTPRLTAFGFGTFVLSMAVSLANRFSRTQAELAALGRDLERRVVERTEELRRRTAEASAANQAKSEFLATMSHELRTPLNALLGMTGLVLDSPLTGEQRESLDIVRRSGESLLDLVNDILDFSKVESGQLELEAQPFSLRTCIEEALDMVAARAAEKGLDLAYAVESDVPALLRGDVTRVRQVLVNLVGNAAKFTAAGGVMVTAERGSGSASLNELHLAVADTGIGIPADRRDRLFRPFSQTDAAHAREYGGTGLGLAISRKLCDLMGGRLWLGEEIGPGSVFHFTLTAEAVEGEVPFDLRSEHPSLAGRKALVVGAGPLTGRMLERCLTSWQMSATAVGSNPEAVEIVRDGGVDVALVGFGMDGDGELATERLRGLRPAGELPIIVLGPLSTRQQMGEALRFGWIARLVTPVHRAQLYGALLQAFGARVPADSRPAEPPSLQPGFYRPPPLRVLVAEDDPLNQKVVLQMLAREGYRADAARNGREVLEALGRKTYDVVLLDVQMPELDGLETARRIRSHWNPGPRLIALTANARPGDREDCLAAGMHDYLSKPVSRSALAAALKRAWPVASLSPSGPPATGEVPASQGVSVQELPVLAGEPLAQLREMQDGSNPGFVAGLVQQFLAEAEHRLASMEAALRASDYAAFARYAHTLKGSSGMLGGRRLAATCAALEQAARAGDDSPGLDWSSLMVGLRAELEALRSQLLATPPSQTT
jgi:signal transduction histidine kinase/DNA-binding response OmpR family regulator/HPt (histidine-containing phosphotransfer) domain-containing protein